MKEREFYLGKLVQSRDTDFVKVITGGNGDPESADGCYCSSGIPYESRD